MRTVIAEDGAATAAFALEWDTGSAWHPLGADVEGPLTLAEDEPF